MASKNNHETPRFKTLLAIGELKRQKRALIARYSGASDVKGLTQAFTTLLPLALLWFVAAFSVNISLWLTAAATLAISLFTLRVLVLMHECGHDSLFRTPRLNRSFGFVFGVIAGMPQFVWSEHHAFHHANNGNWEAYRGPLTTPTVEEFAAMSDAKQRWYYRTRNWTMAPLGGFVYLLFNPRFTWAKGTLELLVHLVRRKIEQPGISVRVHAGSFRTANWKSSREYWHMFWNNVVLLCVWTAMCWAMGAGLFFGVYVISVSLAGGAGIALFTVQHNFEHAHATDRKRWDYDVGALKGTSFLLLPGWLNWFTANIGYHHIHHLSATIPNYSLAACHNEFQQLFVDVPRVELATIPAALNCLLWDVRAQRIISLAEYRTQQGNQQNCGK